jgi:Domain of unknown function (DUF4112)
MAATFATYTFDCSKLLPFLFPAMPRPTSILTTPTPPERRAGKLLGKGSRWFDDRNLDLLAHILDDWFRIPGTSIRFGLDGIIGLVPGLGDVLAGLASLLIPIAAWVRGVPYVTLARMAANVAIAVLVGAIPIAGDAFDIAWQANRRNYKLLTRHLAQPRKHTWKDWAFLCGLGAAVMAVFLAPVILLLWLLTLLRRVF